MNLFKVRVKIKLKGKSFKTHNIHKLKIRSMAYFQTQISQNYRFLTGHSWYIYLNGCRVFHVQEIKLI